MSKLLNDVRSGVRVLLRGRGVTWLAVLALALGIGITTAVFSVFYGVLIKPLPFPNPDELVQVYDIQPACKTCPASFTLTGVTLILVSVVACYLPARQASRTDPMLALRAD